MHAVHFVFRRHGEYLAKEAAHLATQVVAWPRQNNPDSLTTEILAAVEYDEPNGNWYSQKTGDASERRWPGWREAMRDLGVTDFSELDFWYVNGTEPVRNGTPGGDYEVADSWHVELRNDAHPDAVVDVDYYAERPVNGASEIPAEPGEYVVTGMLSYILCTDRENPGSTQTWGRILYDRKADALAYDDISEADQAARFQAARWVGQAAMFMSWDAKPF